MSWINGESDKLDKLLHEQGVPDNARMKAVADYMTILCQVRKETEKHERRQAVLQAVINCKYSAAKAAQQLECSVQNVRYHLKKDKQHA